MAKRELALLSPSTLEGFVLFRPQLVSMQNDFMEQRQRAVCCIRIFYMVGDLPCAISSKNGALQPGVGRGLLLQVSVCSSQYFWFLKY